LGWIDVFADFMVNTWLVGTIVAVVAGVVGFFVVMRGSTFVAHAVPLSAFAGAAGAGLLGISTVVGLGVFSLGASLGIGWLGRRGRHDVVTALSVAMLLGLGALFLSWGQEYAAEVYSLLFGEVLGVSDQAVWATAVLGVLSLAGIALIFRPLLLSSVVPDIAEARGVRSYRMEMAVLVIVALATTTAVPVVGSLLLFSLMVGPPAAARCTTSEPVRALALSVALALITVWVAIAASYETDWPIGFFVGVSTAVWYILGRGWAGWRSRRRGDAAAALPA
jgi:zinc/manganese transport system permease protein